MHDVKCQEYFPGKYVNKVAKTMLEMWSIKSFTHKIKIWDMLYYQEKSGDLNEIYMLSWIQLDTFY
jgi:hypothetical protein